MLIMKIWVFFKIFVEPYERMIELEFMMVSSEMS